jgi:hypothetical protein
LAQEVPLTFYWVSKIEKPLTVRCRGGDFSPFSQLDIHPVDLIAYRPLGGVGKVIGNLASTFVEVAINLYLGIVGFDESNGLFEVFGATKGLPRVIDEISELIVIGIITESPPRCGMYLDFRISF